MEKFKYKQEIKSLVKYHVQNIIVTIISGLYLVFGLIFPDLRNIVYWFVCVAFIVLCFIIVKTHNELKLYFKSYKHMYNETLTYKKLYEK